MEQQPTQIKMTDEIIKGVYSNVMQIQHTQEEFCLDFMSVFAPIGALTSRVIISPGHLKRMIKALEQNLKTHEEQFGTVTEAVEPDKPKFGFGAQ